jgi:hypothetical protein
MDLTKQVDGRDLVTVRLQVNFKYVIDQDHIFEGELRDPERVGFTTYDAFDSVCSQTMVGLMVSTVGTPESLRVMGKRPGETDRFRCIVGEKVAGPNQTVADKTKERPRSEVLEEIKKRQVAFKSRA